MANIENVWEILPERLNQFDLDLLLGAAESHSLQRLCITKLSENAKVVDYLPVKIIRSEADRIQRGCQVA